MAMTADKLWIRCIAACPGVGRRPPGLEERAMGARLGEYFEGMARLEAASVDAFRILRRELAGHRLPRKLDRAMRRAARDEVRHARAARALGRRFGGTYAPPTIEPRPARTLEEIAVDNAVEGCVRETYGALVASYQARAARDAVVRAALERIARDEIRHAALSWQLDGWLRARLDSRARERVASAKRAARTELAATVARGPTRELGEVAGLPSPDVARAMLADLTRALES
jgi:rubrerythrin